LADLNYWLELFLAAGIATLGLVQNRAAVIIGAMLVSPLMGPILATGLALALGDFYFGLKAILNLVASVAAAVAFAAGLVWALPFQNVTAEILARTQPNLLDLGVAVLSGLAGSVVSCRGGAGGGVTALPGVAIAVALMPPLCVVGFGVGSGFQWTIVRGGGLLFLTNLIAIVATEAVAPDRRYRRQQEVSRRTGKPAELSIQEVARREDLLALGRKLETGPVSVPELEKARRQILQTLEPALAAAWPAASAPLADYALVLHPGGLQLQVAYLAAEPIGRAGEEAIRRAVETRAGARLDFVFEPLEPRRNLLRAGQHPKAAGGPLAALAQLLRRRPGLSCRVAVPQPAGAALMEATRQEPERLGTSRARVESSAEPDLWVFATLEVQRP
jgi:uncharacterized hydrophobic protein (TIGR00271 family)